MSCAVIELIRAAFSRQITTMGCVSVAHMPEVYSRSAQSTTGISSLSNTDLRRITLNRLRFMYPAFCLAFAAFYAL
jgi:hypothetical protein